MSSLFDTLLGRGRKVISRLSEKVTQPGPSKSSANVGAYIGSVSSPKRAEKESTVAEKAKKVPEGAPKVELLGGDKLASIRAHLAKYKQAGVVVHPSGKLVIVSPNHAAWTTLNPYKAKAKPASKPKPAPKAPAAPKAVEAKPVPAAPKHTAAVSPVVPPAR